MSTGFTIAKFRDVADGVQPGQFSVGEHQQASGLADLDPIYKDLLDRPITVTLGLIGPDGRVSLTPMWFDHDGERILVNTAAHRPKCGWIRNNPQLTFLVVNPDNAYHWVQIKCTVEEERLEEAEGGEEVTAHLDKVWTKYTGAEPPYGLRDPEIEETRVLFVCRIDRIATFGKPG
jgi:PPOX class probable F420-dependent enzyme